MAEHVLYNGYYAKKVIYHITGPNNNCENRKHFKLCGLIGKKFSDVTLASSQICEEGG